MRLICLAVLLVLSVGYFGRNLLSQLPGPLGLVSPPPSVTIWEHGLQTPNVIATRYQNKVMGYNIGFVFPNDPYQSDDPRLFEYIESNGGRVYEGGGSPGAPLYATFKGVTNTDTANAKLRVILPAFDALIRKVRAGL